MIPRLQPTYPRNLLNAPVPVKPEKRKKWQKLVEMDEPTLIARL